MQVSLYAWECLQVSTGQYEGQDEKMGWIDLCCEGQTITLHCMTAAKLHALANDLLSIARQMEQKIQEPSCQPTN